MKTLSRAWQRLHKADLVADGLEKPAGNKAAINPKHPKAPKSKPLPKAKKPDTSLTAGIVRYANLGLAFAGKMTYDETAARAQLFHRKPGDFAGAHADCSQFCASILHWLGVTDVTDYDYTGTLLQKGKLIPKAIPGCVAIWGPGTGAHAAFVTEVGKTPAATMTVGFGHQGAPDRNSLAGMNEYFESVGEPGVRFLTFA